MKEKETHHFVCPHCKSERIERFGPSLVLCVNCKQIFPLKELIWISDFRKLEVSSS